jgi:ankyrin repeat protein
MSSQLETDLLNYAKSGDLPNVKFMCRLDVDINARNEWGGTPLYLACQNGHLDVVKYLLYAGVNMYLTTHSGRTPLDIAYTIENDEIVQILLDYGAGPYTREEELSATDTIVYETPKAIESWSKASPFLIISNVFQPRRFTILRRIRARIKYLFTGK